MNEEQKKYVLKLLDKEMSYLQDNSYRYKMGIQRPDAYEPSTIKEFKEAVASMECEMKINSEIRDMIK
jgi:hypothetical protein